MYRITCYFRQKEKTLIYEEYVAYSYPQKGELIGISAIKNKPFRSVLGRVTESFPVLENGSNFQNQVFLVAEVLGTMDDSITVEALSL